MLLEQRVVRWLVAGVCASFVALVGAAVFTAVSLSGRGDERVAGDRNVTIEGGGCPAESSVVAASGSTRLGSTRSDRAGNFRFTVALPDADRASLVSVTCGTIALTLSEPARETTRGGRSIAVTAFLSGALILVAVLIVLLRRRVARDMRESVTAAQGVRSSDRPDRVLSEVPAGRGS